MQRIFTPMEKMMQEMRSCSDPFYMPKNTIQNPNGFMQQPNETIDNTVSDPGLNQAKAEESFHAEQIRSGQEIFQSGKINNAADSQNLQAFLDSQSYSQNPGEDYDAPSSSFIEPLHSEKDHIEPEPDYFPDMGKLATAIFLKATNGHSIPARFTITVHP